MDLEEIILNEIIQVQKDIWSLKSWSLISWEQNAWYHWTEYEDSLVNEYNVIVK
jgi:hypothetical protein